MLTCCKKNTGVGAEAKVVGNALVVSFLCAGQPRVWRADMSHVSSALFEIEESQGKAKIVMKTPANAPEEIGVFTDRAQAADALRIITVALLGGAAAHPAPRGGFFRRLLKGIMWILGILFVLFVMLSLFAPRPAPQMTNGQPQTSAPGVRPGVPIPAENLFKD